MTDSKSIKSNEKKTKPKRRENGPWGYHEKRFSFTVALAIKSTHVNIAFFHLIETDRPCQWRRVKREKWR